MGLGISHSEAHVLSTLLLNTEDRFIRYQFDAKARLDFYRVVSRLLRNGVLIHEILDDMYRVASEDGRRPRLPKAVILHECRMAIAEGRALSSALERWAGHQEASLIAAGEGSGNLADALDDAAHYVKSKKGVAGAVAQVVAYPSVLGGLICVLLNIVAEKLVPKFAMTSDPSTWEGSGRALYIMSELVNRYGVLIGALVLSTVVLAVTTLGRFTGPVRVHLDKFPPWSIYRMLNGSSFLLNVSVLIAAGIKLADALESLTEHATPYLRERIEAVLYGVKMGSNFGAALRKAGYNFPDEEAIQFIEMIAGRDGFEAAMKEYAKDWLNDSVERVTAMASVIFNAFMLVITLLVSIIAMGIFSIEQTMSAAT
ncbi:secretion system protein F [Burkholderia stagnalis]|nr:secretion system protein F [Burkholderia stagnalis]RQR20301.1 secretion system protein F [Burkholderia stagnalis]